MMVGSPCDQLQSLYDVSEKLCDVDENDESRNSIPSRLPTINSAAAASTIRGSAKKRKEKFSFSSLLSSPTTTYADSIAKETSPKSRQEATAGDEDTNNTNNNFHAIGHPLLIK